MSVYIAIALTMVITAVTGCKRDTQLGTSATQNLTKSSDNITDTDIPRHTNLRQSDQIPMPQPDYSPPYHKQSQNEIKKGGTKNSGRAGAERHDSVPETSEQATHLMQRLDQEILNNELDPAVATYFKASFRGRLLAAGIPKEDIENWINQN